MQLKMVCTCSWGSVSNWILCVCIRGGAGSGLKPNGGLTCSSHRPMRAKYVLCFHQVLGVVLEPAFSVIQLACSHDLMACHLRAWPADGGTQLEAVAIAIARAFILGGRQETLVAQAIAVAISNYGSSQIQPLLLRAPLYALCSL